ncbi:MAG: LamG domain-containing protein, partial [Thermoguttaceae bacterium]
VEAIFRPDAGGAREQRFIHIQDEGERRAMLEIRLLPDGWYADTFLRSGRAQRALNDPKLLHPAGRWHNLTLVYDGQQMTQYVNGRRELSARVAFQPMEKGQVSLGARLNDVFWFQGAILKVRFTPRAISPDEFLKAPEK